jgi:hypothetical protein
MMPKWGLSLFFIGWICGAAAGERVLDLGGGQSLKYEILDPGSKHSAAETGREILRLLAAGEIIKAAELSNAPKRRLEVFREFRSRVGDEEFRRVFQQYLGPGNKLMAEVAMGKHRLLIWKLGDAADHLAGQYYVQTDGKFLMDDVPSTERSNLRKILDSYRIGVRP